MIYGLCKIWLLYVAVYVNSSRLFHKEPICCLSHKSMPQKIPAKSIPPGFPHGLWTVGHLGFGLKFPVKRDKIAWDFPTWSHTWKTQVDETYQHLRNYNPKLLDYVNRRNQISVVARCCEGKDDSLS